MWNVPENRHSWVERPRPLFLCSLPPPPPPTYNQHQPEALHGQGAKSASQQVGGLGRAGPLTLTWCLRGWAFLSANCPHCAHPTPSTQPPNRRMSVPVTPSEKTHISQVLKAHSVSKKLKTRTRIISQTYKACVCMYACVYMFVHIYICPIMLFRTYIKEEAKKKKQEEATSF